MARQRSLITLANEKVPFPVAAGWAGVEVYADPGERGIKTYCPFGAVEHPDGGDEPSLRVYADHGWCFAEDRYLTVVSLLAEVWQVTREDAAAEALQRHGYVPANYAQLFDAADRDPPPDKEALAGALTAWCERTCPDWHRQATDDPVVAHQLATCLGLLPLVHTAEDCETWLGACKQAMAKVLTAVN